MKLIFQAAVCINSHKMYSIGAELICLLTQSMFICTCQYIHLFSTGANDCHLTRECPISIEFKCINYVMCMQHDNIAFATRILFTFTYIHIIYIHICLMIHYW